MADIKKELNDIKNAVYGREVRGSIHDGIKKINDEVENTTDRQDSVEAQFQSVLDEMTEKDVTSAPEILAARVGADNTNYPNLKERLDTEHNQFSSQLAEIEQKKADKTEVNQLADEKADKAALALVAQSKRDKDVEIGMADLDQEVREAFTGGAVPVVGEDAVGRENLRNNSVTREKLNKNYAINFPYLSDDSYDLDYVWDEGNYIVSGTVLNNPFKTGCTLKVERHKTLENGIFVWITQTATLYGSQSDKPTGTTLRRLLRVNENTLEIALNSGWKEITQPDKITSDMLDEDYAIKEYLSDETYDLDNVRQQGNYIVNRDVRNNPFGLGCVVTVDRYRLDSTSPIIRIVQTATCYATAHNRKYYGRTARRYFTYNENTLEITNKSEWTDGKEEPIKILTIGNSFGLDATKYVHRICQGADINVMCGNLYISGGYFEDHYENITNDNKAYRFYRRYHVDGTITDDFLENYSVDDALNLEEWDYVFFNQASAQSGVYDSFQPYLTNIIDYVKTKQPNAKIALMPTWAYSSDFDDTRFDEYNRNQLTMYNAIIEAYKQAMEEVDFDVIIPAGTAIQNARTDDYLMSIERELTRDGYHLSDAGCFIVGVAFVKSLINKHTEIDFIPDTLNKKITYVGKVAAENAVLNPFVVTEIE